MLVISRKFGESLSIGSVRLTFVSKRAKVAEVMIVRGKTISLIHLPEFEDYWLSVDGESVLVNWRGHYSCGHFHFRVGIDAPRHIKVTRDELLEPAASLSEAIAE